MICVKCMVEMRSISKILVLVFFSFRLCDTLESKILAFNTDNSTSAINTRVSILSHVSICVSFFLSTTVKNFLQLQTKLKNFFSYSSRFLLTAKWLSVLSRTRREGKKHTFGTLSAQSKVIQKNNKIF